MSAEVFARVVVEIRERLEDDDLARFVSNLEGEAWFECRTKVVRSEPVLRSKKPDAPKFCEVEAGCTEPATHKVWTFVNGKFPLACRPHAEVVAKQSGCAIAALAGPSEGEV